MLMESGIGFEEIFHGLMLMETEMTIARIKFEKTSHALMFMEIEMTSTDCLINPKPRREELCISLLAFSCIAYI